MISAPPESPDKIARLFSSLESSQQKVVRPSGPPFYGFVGMPPVFKFLAETPKSFALLVGLVPFKIIFDRVRKTPKTYLTGSRHIKFGIETINEFPTLFLTPRKYC